MATTSPNAVSIFFSYAGADNAAQFGWIENFRKQLEPALEARLKRIARLDTVHSYVVNGAISGNLDDQLTQRVEASAAMVVFVHENYLDSDACRTELDAFTEKFGRDGLDSRLFVVAMSQRAATELADQPHWLEVVQTEAAEKRQQIWLDFYDPEARDSPLKIFREAADGAIIMSDRFQTKLSRLLDGLVASIKLHTAKATTAPVAAPALTAPTMRRWLVGACVPELQAEARRMAHALTSGHAGDVEMMSSESLLGGDVDAFERADELVLPFNDAPVTDSGYLALQQRAWIAARKSPERIHWLDLRDIKSNRNATSAQQDALGKLVQRPVKFEQLLQNLTVAAPNGQDAVVYIESNRRELDHWESLGQRLIPHWNRIADGDASPQLKFRHRGLPIDQLADLPNLVGADGFILLWGQKDPDSLVAQISEVEKRVRADPDLPPGIVAYLMPPRSGTTEAVPAYGWRVLKFNAKSVTDIDIAQGESERLQTFLRQVYGRVMRRRK